MAAPPVVRQNGSSNAGLFTELGSTGVQRYGGLLYEEWLKPLRQYDERIRVFKQMREEPILAAGLYAIEMLVRGVSWDVQAVEETPEALEAAAFVAGALFTDMSGPWHDVLSEIMSMLVFGYAFHEIVYKRRQGERPTPGTSSRFTDGRIGWRKFPIRSQDTLSRWVFDEEGGLQGMEQLDSVLFSRVVIPIEKALLFRVQSTKGNPEGRSVLRAAYVPWYHKTRIQQIQGIGIERDLAGLPVAWVPPQILTPTRPEEIAAAAAFKDLVRNIRRDEQEGLLFPLAYDAEGNKLYDITLLSTGGRRQFDTKAILEYYDRQMAISFLVDVVLLGHEQVGSFALADSKTSLLGLSIAAILDSIATVLNRHALPRLWRLNGLPQPLMPIVSHGDVESVDLEELGNFILRTAQAGFDFKDVEGEVRRRAGFPQRADIPQE